MYLVQKVMGWIPYLHKNEETMDVTDSGPLDPDHQNGQKSFVTDYQNVQK